MGFVRPEILDGLRRWREALSGLVLALAGLLAWFSQAGFLAALGLFACGIGILVLYAGWQRGRFRQGAGGPGVVELRERLVAYFGPLSDAQAGGARSVDTLSLVELDTRARPSAWILHAPGEPPLKIPTSAENAEALFDVFESLPGIETEHMLAALQAERRQKTVIWRRGARLLDST